jgi:hypothetical protein
MTTKTKTETAPRLDPVTSAREILARPEQERLAAEREKEAKVEREAQAQLVTDGTKALARLGAIERPLTAWFDARPPERYTRGRELSPPFEADLDRVIQGGQELLSRVRVLGAVRAHLAKLQAQPLGRAQLEGLADLFAQTARDVAHLEVDARGWRELAAQAAAGNRSAIETATKHIAWLATAAVTPEAAR